MNKVLWFLVACCLALATFPLQAQVPPVTQYSGSLLTIGDSHVVALNGYSTCSAALGGTASGFSVTYQGSSDNGATWNTITSMGSSGIETSLVTDTGNVVSQSNGATLLFRIAVTELTSGTLTYTESCSSAVGLGSGGGAASNVTIVGPTSAPGGTAAVNVNITNLASPNPLPITCISGCSSSGAFTTPLPVASAGVSPATTPLPLNLDYPLCYYPAGATPNLTGGTTIALECGANGALNVNVFGTITVNTPAPVATVFIVNTPAVNQGTNPWVVNTPAPAATDASGGIKVSIVNQASPVPLIVTTPAPVATIFVVNTPSVLVANTTAPVVLATATAGVAGSSALLTNAQMQCIYPVGGTPNVTAGNVIAVQCSSGGALQVAGTLTVNTPAPVATVFIVNTPGVLAENTTPPTAAPVATTGAVPTAAPPVIAETTCFVPPGGTPNITGGNILILTCNANGSLIVAPQSTVPPATTAATPSPVPAPTMLPVEGFNQGLASGGWFPFIICDKSVAISDATSGYTELVAAASGKKIYVCSFSFQSAGTVNVYFAQGTKVTTACDTSEAAITGAYQEVVNTGVAANGGISPLWIGTVSNELCVDLSGSVGIYGVLSYAQL